jgi:vacuolar-type H+-ATPase subunit E/Vma4
VVKTAEDSNTAFDAIVSATDTVSQNEQQVLIAIQSEQNTASGVRDELGSMQEITQGVYDNSKTILDESANMDKEMRNLSNITGQVKDSCLSIVSRAADADSLAGNSMGILKQSLDTLGGVKEKVSKFKTE